MESHRLRVPESFDTFEFRRLFLNFLFAPLHIELDYFRMSYLGAFIGQHTRNFGRAFDAALSKLFVEGPLNSAQFPPANRLAAQTKPLSDDELLFAAWLALIAHGWPLLMFEEFEQITPAESPSPFGRGWGEGLAAQPTTSISPLSAADREESALLASSR